MNGEPVGVWADECTQHSTHWLFVSFFFSQRNLVVIWRRLLGHSLISLVCGYRTAQQQDAGRFGGVGGEVDGRPERNLMARPAIID